MNRSMIKTIFASLVFSVSCLVNVANAGLISGNHTTDDGKNVNLSGLTWHTWDIVNISRQAVEAEMVSGGLYEDFRYATRAEFEALFDSLWGGTYEGWSSTNADGGNWLYQNFGGTFSGTSGSDVFYGADGECHVNSLYSCRAHWRGGNSHTGGDSTSGWFTDHYGLSVGLDAINNASAIHKATVSQYFAHALVLKSSEVPEPSTLAIIALGLVGLASRRFKNQS